MIDRAALAALIPHAGSMCLLDLVESWDAQQIRCLSTSHRDPAHPLLSAGSLSALHLIEYGAQAMAVHGGLLAQQLGRRAAPGMLAAIRNLQLSIDELQHLQDPLCVAASKRLVSASGSLYDFEVHAGSRLLACGRLSVITAATDTTPSSG